MATLSLDNLFASYVLAPSEEQVGKVLSSAQIYVIQNKLSQVAHQRINVDFNTLDSGSSLKDSAWLDGQILAYQGMLTDHENASRELKETPLKKVTN